MLRKLSLPWVLFMGVLTILLFAASPLTAAFGSNGETYEVVFSVPIGDKGVHYAGVNISEALPWGPAALAIASDGSFWIADTVGNRLLHYTAKGEAINTIDLNDYQVVGVGDLAVSTSDLLVLDIAAVTPQVLRLSFEGKWLASYPVPEDEDLDNGLSGIALGERGEVLLERENGAFVSRLVDADGRVDPVSLEGYAYRGQLYEARPAAVNADATHGYIMVGTQRIPASVSNRLGGLYLLGINLDGSFYAVLEEVAIGSAIQVDQTVRQYSAAGELVQQARVPLAEQHTYVAHGLAVGPDQTIYALVTLTDRIEVRRLSWTRELKPILPVALASISGSNAGQAPLACVSRSTMISTASGYRNNSKYLSSTNTDGACSGRGKPRYIGGAGTYSSVAYDWGGWDTVSGYNGYMSPNTYKAGDINTAGVESCSRGVDCSGFVSRVWQLGSKYGTCTLPNISTKLSSTSQLLQGDIMNKCGSHVVLFYSFATSGIYDYEATTYNSYDRVVYIYSSWSRLSGYEPRRYNSVCP